MNVALALEEGWILHFVTVRSVRIDIYLFKTSGGGCIGE